MRAMVYRGPYRVRVRTSPARRSSTPTTRRGDVPVTRLLTFLSRRGRRRARHGLGPRARGRPVGEPAAKALLRCFDQLNSVGLLYGRK